MSEWQACTLSDVLKFGNGKSRPKEYGTIPVYGGNGILDYTNSSNYQDETIVIGRVGAYCGATYYEDKQIWVSDNALSAKALNRNDAKFLYYFLKNLDLNQFAQGSSHPLLTQTLLNSIEVVVPSSPLEQKAIASVLSSLDDKIDLLHRQNKTLEAMAETLFRQWFIEEAKEDWEEASLGSLFTISSGKGLKREQFRDHGLIPVLGANGEIGRTDQVMFEEFLIYTGRVGTLGKVSIIEGQPVWLSDNTLVFRDIEYFYFTYFQLKAVNYQEYNVGSTQPLIRQSDIKEIAVLLPSDLDMIKRFELQAKDIFGKIQTNTKQIQTLENLRNTLLPKLMSGEVRVQYQTEEVA